MNKLISFVILALFSAAAAAQAPGMKARHKARHQPAASSASTQPAAPALQETAGVLWFCGGVGADERRAMAGLEAQSNLKLLFVSAKRGGYLADADLAIYAGNGKTALFTTRADGPVCLLHLAPGRYRIEASMGQAKRITRTSLAAGAKNAQQLVFSFPEEPWDGIRADPEEKRQAKEL
jgi:hypothetical protein